MTLPRPKLIIANWKMNGTRVLARTLTRAAGDTRGRLIGQKRAAPDVVLCPPFPYLDGVGQIISGGVMLGAQDVALDAHPQAGQTGDVSAPMLADMGCSYVIIGHSERRARYGETEATARGKAAAVIAAGMTPIICVGETAQDRAGGQAFETVKTQILGSIPEKAEGEQVVLAYEPVWAIGAGKPATLDDISSMHGFMASIIRENLRSLSGLRMIYGGSVGPGNAREILALPLVDGALVGGASLDPESFAAIIEMVV